MKKVLHIYVLRGMLAIVVLGSYITVSASPAPLSLPRQFDSLFFLSKVHMNLHPDKSISLLDEAREIAVRLADSALIAKCFFSRGEAYRNMGENLLSLENFFVSLDIYNNLKDETGIAGSMNEIGRVYRYLGVFDKSLDYHLKAIELFGKLNNQRGFASSLINAGVVYRNLGYDEKALQNYQIALDISMSLNDTLLIVSALISTGNIYYYLNEYQKALYFYSEAYAMSVKNSHSTESASGALNNLGNVYRELGETEKALGYYNRSLELSKEIGDKNLIAVSLKNIGIAYSREKNYNKATEYLLRGNELSQEIRLRRVLMETIEELSNIYYQSGNYKLALEYYKDLGSLKDSIFDEEAKNKIAMLRIDFELNEKSRENEMLLKNLELSGIKAMKDRNLRDFLIIISVLIIVLAFVIHKRYVEKHRLNEELKKMNMSLEKRVEERTSRLQEENERRKQAQMQAELANAEKTRFLATINHEVRTPINAIIGFCDLTMKSGLTAPQMENLQRVRDSSHHLLALFKDILDYSQIEAGKMELTKSAVDLPDMLHSVTNAFFLDAKSKNITLDLEIEPKVPRYIIADPGCLSQILFSLVGNAIKFTDKGRIEVKVSVQKEQSLEEDLLLLCSVKDTGIGISRFKQKLIFKDFIQEDVSSSRKYGGAGLGLTISKHFVEMMGGKIWVESEKGSGSTFSFTIRTKRAEPPPGKEPQKTLEVKKGLNILVAEDNILNAQVVTAFLKRMGHSAKTASNGLIALDLLATEKFDAVLMDIEMPEMDGIEATKSIRSGTSKALNPQVPIIALTAHALKDYKEISLKAGMNEYMTKPLDIKRLSQILEAI